MNLPLPILSLGLLFGFSPHLRAAEPAEGARTLSFELLSTANRRPGAPPRFSKQLADLAGKKVRITGFVCPYDQHAIALKKFILTPRMNEGCYSCNPPEDDCFVFVRLPANAVPMHWKSDTVTVEGTLRLMGRNGKDAEDQKFLYTVDDAAVVPRK